MKKIVLTAILVFFVVATGNAQNLMGKMLSGGYLGYSFGMGDQFDDYEGSGYKAEFNAGFSLGGQFFYGFSEKFMIGGELMLQSYSFKVDYNEGPDYDDSELKFAILGNVLYPINYTDEKALFLIGGLGFYDRDDLGLGFNAGIMYRFAIGENLYFFGMPRLHFLFADPSGQMIQIAVGLQYPIGN